MANRFLSNISINDEYTLPSADGNVNQIISTNGAGTLSFVNASSVAVTGSGTATFLPVWNTSTGLTSSNLYQSITGDVIVGTNVELRGKLVATDHGTATTPQVVNVVYGTSATPPVASTTTEGTLYIQYTP